MAHQAKRNAAFIGIMALLLFLGFLLLPAQAVQSEDANGLVLVIEPETATIYTGQTQQYRAYLSHDGGATLGDEVTEECTWSVDDTDVGETTATKGLIAGVGLGETTVRASYYSESLVRAPVRLFTEAKLIVQEWMVFHRIWLEVDPQTATIEVGETQQYRAYLKSTDPAIEQEVTADSTWTLDEDIATPTDKGRYRGEREGSSSLTAEYVFQPPDAGDPVTLSDDAELNVVEKEDEDIPEDDPGDEPETEDLPEGKMINRQPGYITLSEPLYLGAPGVEFTLSYDPLKMDGHPDRYPRVFYWNETYEKWVALASHPLSPGSVRAVNDGAYAGWFVVFGCIQPHFTDIPPAQQWAEPATNRMNGLGLVSGYEVPEDPASLKRPVGLERVVTRAELTTVVARILGLAPGDTHLYPTLTFMTDAENDIILEASYSDADQIPYWVRKFVAAMTKADLVRPKGDRFAPQDQMTRIEAAVMISDALRDVPGFGDPLDLNIFTDADEVPEWAVGEVAEGTIRGYPDGSLRPNEPINRAESFVLLLRLLRGLGW